MAYFAASVDTPDVNAEFAKSLELDFPILSDPAKGVATAYGVVGGERPFAQRWTFYIGTDGKILAIEKKIAVATAGRDVAAKLTELGVGKKK